MDISPKSGDLNSTIIITSTTAKLLASDGANPYPPWSDTLKTTKITIAAGTEDAAESSDGTVRRNGNILEFKPGNLVGLRFNADIPSSAIVYKAELVFRILALYRQTRERMAESKLPDSHRADIEQQCEHLVYAGFVRHTPGAWLARLPAYFQALQKRIDKSERDLAPADRMLPLIRELWQSYLEIEASAPRDAGKLEQLRWMLEEFRVGCFAQPMKTRIPVSEQRLRRLIDELS